MAWGLVFRELKRKDIGFLIGFGWFGGKGVLVIILVLLFYRGGNWVLERGGDLFKGIVIVRVRGFDLKFSVFCFFGNGIEGRVGRNLGVFSGCG